MKGAGFLWNSAQQLLFLTESDWEVLRTFFSFLSDFLEVLQFEAHNSDFHSILREKLNNSNLVVQSFYVSKI